MERVALIGCGAIGRLLLERLAAPGGAATLAAIVARPASFGKVRAALPAEVTLCASVAEALAAKPTLFVECAGHAALREHAAAVLGAGVDLLVASVGALADAELERSLTKAARASGASVLLPSGALGGLDALAAARQAGLDDVEYVGVKPVRAWQGTYAEQLIELSKVERATVFFSGNAREAASRFPQNANVAAAVALAGVGFESTRVSLSADPQAKGNRHVVRARGAFGSMEVTIEGKTLPANPKTSILAPLSLLRAIEARGAALRVV